MRLTWRPPRRGHRCGPDHEQGVGFGLASRGRGRPSVPSGRGLARPRSPVGGVCAVQGAVGQETSRSGPAPCRPGLAATGGLAQPLATGRVTLAARGPPPPAGQGGGGSRARRYRAGPPWEPPQPSSNDQYPSLENTALQRKASSIPQPGAKPPSSPFLCRVIRLLTHPEKHSPPSCPCGVALAPPRPASLSPRQCLPPAQDSRAPRGERAGP